MLFTTNYSLKKPEGNDNFDKANDNSNMDTIDATMKANADTASAAQATADAAETPTGAQTKADSAQSNAEAYALNLPTNALSRQAVINGNFDVWQRGTSWTNPASAIYSTDRFLISYTEDGGILPANLIHSKLGLTQPELPGSNYAYRISPDGAGSGFGVNASYGIFQRIENATVYLCGAGKKLTLTFWARSSIAGKRIGIGLSQRYGTGGTPSATESITGQIITLTSTWTKYTVVINTNTLSGKTFGTNNDDYFQIGFFYMWGTTIATGTFGGGTAETFGGAGNIDIAQIQVNSGDQALPFQPRSFADELALCQRYYEKSYDYGVFAGANTLTGLSTGVALDSGIIAPNIYFKSRKRVNPTVNIYSSAGTSGQVSIFNTQTDAGATGFSIVNGGEAQITRIGKSGGSALTTGNQYWLAWTADAEL